MWVIVFLTFDFLTYLLYLLEGHALILAALFRYCVDLGSKLPLKIQKSVKLCKNPLDFANFSSAPPKCYSHCTFTVVHCSLPGFHPSYSAPTPLELSPAVQATAYMQPSTHAVCYSHDKQWLSHAFHKLLRRLKGACCRSLNARRDTLGTSCDCNQVCHSASSP